MSLPAPPFRSLLLPEHIQFRIRYYPRANAVAHYINETVPLGIDLRIAAERAGMAPNAFSRYFVSKVGITLSSLIRTLRVERAVAEMHARACPVSCLASCAGYESESGFCRAFKDVTGQSPSEYRRRLALKRAEPPR